MTQKAPNHPDKQLLSTIAQVASTHPGLLDVSPLALMDLMRTYAEENLAKRRRAIQYQVLNDLALFGSDQIQFYYTEKSFRWTHTHWHEMIAQGYDMDSLLQYITPS